VVRLGLWIDKTCCQRVARLHTAVRLAARSRRRAPSWVCQALSGGLLDRLEEGDQCLGDGLGYNQWGKVPDAR
jgi:hypothetical protein